MNQYLGAMTVVVRKHRGTLDKYIGDAIMAFLGCAGR
jgi:adenylate cyclase